MQNRIGLLRPIRQISKLVQAQVVKPKVSEKDFSDILHGDVNELHDVLHDAAMDFYRYMCKVDIDRRENPDWTAETDPYLTPKLRRLAYGNYYHVFIQGSEHHNDFMRYVMEAILKRQYQGVFNCSQKSSIICCNVI